MVQARYDSVADLYAHGWSDDLDPPTEPLLDLLGSVASARVLDSAGGHGRVSRALSAS
jgi:hypothetical protein